MSIHSRRAAGAVLDRLEGHTGAGSPVLHWFSGTKRELERAMKLGCWFSVGPVMLQTEKGRDLWPGACPATAY
jgi:TatD DNase family protein